MTCNAAVALLIVWGGEGVLIVRDSVGRSNSPRLNATP
jgi:hypothetical protein